MHNKRKQKARKTKKNEDLEMKNLTLVGGCRLTQERVKWNGFVSDYCCHAGKKQRWIRFKPNILE